MKGNTVTLKAVSHSEQLLRCRSSPAFHFKNLSGKGYVASPRLKNNNIHATNPFALINLWFIRIPFNPDKVFMYQPVRL